MCRGRRVIAWANGIGEIGGLSAVTQDFLFFSEEEVKFLEMADFCIVDPMSLKFQVNFQKKVEQRVSQFFQMNPWTNPGSGQSQKRNYLLQSW